MASSDDLNNNTKKNNNIKAIDASVGTLVWVRRRNGSWWPGRIMGLDEISEGSLVSPRSGTPVKLLGREDASVDWYNLEKSKRVKAFRCGEYDECIEKAKANATNGNKKAVKYARREDAILHALEIENTRLGKNNADFCLRKNDSGADLGSSAKDSSIVSDSSEEDASATKEGEEEESDSSDSKEDSDSDSGSTSGSDSETGSDSGSDSAPELSHSGISFEEPSYFCASKMQSERTKRRRTPNDSEDDGSEGTKRMRGLEDLGMVVGDSNAGNCLSNGISVNGNKGYNSFIKRKRTQVANVHECLKRKNRCRPLTKVLDSTAMVSVPVTCKQLPNSGVELDGVSESKACGIDSIESRKSLVNNNSESTGISCENGTSLNPSEHIQDGSHICKLKEENDFSGIAQNDSSDRLFDVPFVGVEKDSAGFSPGLGSSSGRHQVDRLGMQCSQSSQSEAAVLKNEGFNESGSTGLAATHIHVGFSPRMEKDASEWQLKGKRNSRHMSKNRKQEKRKYMVMNDEPDTYMTGSGSFEGPDRASYCDGTRRPVASHNLNLKVKPFPRRITHIRGDTAEASLPPQRSLPYRQSRFTVNSRYQTSEFPGRTITGCKLYDIKIEVKGNYEPQNVPLVSLMSKLGKAIIGRPLPVGQLADGYCDAAISSIECDPSHASITEAAELAPVALLESEPGSNPAKYLTVRPCTALKKSAKRKSRLLSKKIRKLSSLTVSKEENKRPVVDKLKGSVIACIPVKIVFSRINEAVNGSSRHKHACALPVNNS